MNEEKKAEMTIMGLALALLFVSMSWPLLKFGSLEVPLPDEASYAKWITSAFIIAEVAFAPVAGKLVDHLGLRPCVIFGAVVFAISSLGLAFADGMRIFLVFRFLQGVGGAFIFASAFASPGILLPHGKRGPMHGMLSGAFAIGSLFGTGLGVYFVENFGWKYIFYIPCIMVVLGVAVALRNLPRKESIVRGFDIPGFILIFVSTVMAMFYTQAVDNDFEMFGLESLLILVTVVMSTLALYFREAPLSKTGALGRFLGISGAVLTIGITVCYICLLASSELPPHGWLSQLFLMSIVLGFVGLYFRYFRATAPNPVFPASLRGFSGRIVLAIMFIGITVIGLLQNYVKVYLIALHFDIYEACGMFLFLLIGAAITAIPGGRIVPYTGARPWCMLGCALCAAGCILTHFFVADGWVHMAVCLTVLGSGLGCMVTLLLVSLHGITRVEDMGATSAITMGYRLVAISTGLALYGRFMDMRIEQAFSQHHIDFHGETILDVIIAILEYGMEIFDDIMGAIINSFKECALAGAVFSIVGIFLAYGMRSDDKGLCGERPPRKKLKLFAKRE